MKTFFALLALISVAASVAALAKDKNTKLKIENKSIAAPTDESRQKSTNLKQLRGMQPLNAQVHNGQGK